MANSIRFATRLSAGLSATALTSRSIQLVIAMCAIGAVSSAQGQETYLEEIIVTATKAPAGSNVQETAVSITALTGDYLTDAGIKDVFDMQQNTPGLIVGQSQASTTSNFSIRGIGTSSNNFGLESSVGLYVDGVYRSRQSSMINDLIDVAAVEVMRGPQGTLFGKNTPQGAIHMLTRKPSQDRDAFVEVTAGDYGLVKISAATNISLSDNTAIRGTIFSSQRDGIVSDTNLGGDLMNDRDRIGGRLQLYSTLSDKLDLRIIADYAEIDELCCAAIARVDSLYSQVSLTAPGGPVPGTDAALASLGGTIFTGFPYPDALLAPFGPFVVPNTGFDEYQLAYNSIPRSTNEDAGLSVEFNYDLSDNATITSITAYRSFDTFDTIDADFTNVDLLERINKAQQSSISQELRMAGGIGDTGSYVFGVYYFSQDLDTQKETNGGPMLGAYVDIVEPDVPAAVGGINLVSALTMGVIPPAGVAFPLSSFSADSMMQEHESVAVFGQVEIPMGDQWSLTLGARYTDEDKTMLGTFVQDAQGPPPDLDALAFSLCQASPLCGPPLGLPPFNPFDPATQAVFAPFAIDGWGSYLFDPLAPRPDLNEQLKDDQVTGTAKLSWRPNDDTMLYLSYGTGYKSGGTNTDRINAAFDPIFGAETSATIEFGIKADFPEQDIRLNIAVYDTQVDDLQANSFTGTGFNLQNAGKADTSGAEIEFWWYPSETFTVQSFYARSNADYKSFENGTCWDAYVFHTGMPDPGGSGDIDDEVCSKTGGRIAYNPEDRFYLGLTKDFALTGSTTAFVRAEYSYASDLLTDGDLDPFTLQDSLDIYNLRLGLRWGDDGDSELVAWGRNLGDERYYAGSFDAPIQPGRMNSYPAEPRTYGLTYRKNFR